MKPSSSPRSGRAMLAQSNRIARVEAARRGLGALDALHVPAAHILQADELVTTEKPGKAIHRASLIRVTYLFA